MRILFTFIVLLFILTFEKIQAQETFGFGFMNVQKERCVSEEQSRLVAQEIAKNQKKLRLAATAFDPVLFDWPLRQKGVNDYAHYAISNFVDLDATTGVRDYNCGTRTYDGHNGIDLFTTPYSWAKMDDNNVEVIAAAPGTIVYKADGNYDRQCQWMNGTNWNAVYVQHADGTVAWYGHLKNGSLTSKAIGATVQTGEYLGVVGSSGYSSGPHLHFELHASNGAVIDPFSGSCGNMTSRWLNQKPYYDFSVCKLMTHSSAPTPYPSCPTTTDNMKLKTNYLNGEVVYATIYMRDQNGQTGQFRILRPNGSVWQQWSQTFTPYYASSYWWWSYTLPSAADTGTWKFEVTISGKIHETFFNVNTTQTPCPQTRFASTNINQTTAQLKASQSLTATGIVESTANVTFNAGNNIVLNPGFQAQKGANFLVKTQGCP